MNDSSVPFWGRRQLLSHSNSSWDSEGAEGAEDYYENLFQWMTEGLLIFIIGIIGLVGNGISIWTFSRQRIHRIFHNLLLVLAIFDIVSILLGYF